MTCSLPFFILPLPSHKDIKLSPPIIAGRPAAKQGFYRQILEISLEKLNLFDLAIFLFLAFRTRFFRRGDFAGPAFPDAAACFGRSRADRYAHYLEHYWARQQRPQRGAE